MPESTTKIFENITFETGPNPDATIIWLHGLGADGNDFVPIAKQLQLPPTLAIRFIFPHAPIRPISLNQGAPMRGWYDLYGLTLGTQEDVAGIKETCQSIFDLCRQQQQLGIKSERIILAGFSQGGAMALYSGLRYPDRLAGIMALSSYLCLADSLVAEMSPHATELPLFMAHGSQDDVLKYEYGQHSAALLKAAGIRPDWHTYVMGHSLCPEEVTHIRQWIINCL